MAAQDGPSGHDVPPGPAAADSAQGRADTSGAGIPRITPEAAAAIEHALNTTGILLTRELKERLAQDADSEPGRPTDAGPGYGRVAYVQGSDEPGGLDGRGKLVGAGVAAAVVATVVVVMVATSSSHSAPARGSKDAHSAIVMPPAPSGVATQLLATGTGTPAPVFDPDGGGDGSATAGTDAPVAAGVVPVAMPKFPLGPISLSGWKLTLPVSKSGALTGKAKQLQTAAITSPWLDRGADGSLVFWAPATGATTSNSEHARTELVSDNDFTFGKGKHTMSATLSVTQVPDGDQDIDVGQIHGGGAINSIPFVMLHWREGNIVVVIKTEMHGSGSQTVTLLTGVPLGAKFSYQMTDDGDGSLTLTAAYDGQARQAVVPVESVFMGTDERFQVGDYQQAESGTSVKDGGRVTFYGIATS